MRREKIRLLRLLPIYLGSPPHAQGKVCGHCNEPMKYGITPACAGKSLIHRYYTAVVRITPACAGKRLGCVAAGASIWDHPRMRREKYTLLVVLHLTLGSPPHAQGKECSFERFYVQPGITPACAGKSPKESHQIPPSQDHPRMRREKTKKDPKL